MSVPNIPSKINSYNVYNDAERLIGVGDEVTLPDFEAMAETISGAGILGELDDPTVGHFSNMEMEIPFRVLDREATDMLDMTKAVRLTLRAAQQALTVEGDTEFRSMRVVVRGKSATLAMGSVQNANPMESSVTLNVSYIRIEVDGTTLVELDKINPTFKVNGVDLLQKVREMT